MSLDSSSRCTRTYRIVIAPTGLVIENRLSLREAAAFAEVFNASMGRADSRAYIDEEAPSCRDSDVTVSHAKSRARVAAKMLSTA